MFRFVRRWLDALTVLCASSWRWLTPRARVYKGLSCSTLVLLVLALIDGLFNLPRMEGWLALISLTGVAVLTGIRWWMWSTDEALDVPSKWRARVGR